MTQVEIMLPKIMVKIRMMYNDYCSAGMLIIMLLSNVSISAIRRGNLLAISMMIITMMENLRTLIIIKIIIVESLLPLEV